MAIVVDMYRREANFARVLTRSAPVSSVLLAVIALVFAGTYGAGLTLSLDIGAADGDWYFGQALANGMKINELIRQDWQWWRLFSHSFMHGSWLHILLNGYALFLIGPLLERLYGSRRFLIIYTLSALSGGAASVLLTDGPMVGASGAIFGCLGALVVFATKFKHLVPPRVSRALGVKLVPWIVLNLLIGFLPWFAMIDHAAHVGGLIGGTLVAAGLSTPLRAQDNRTAKVALELAFAAAVLALCYGLVFMAVQTAVCTTSGVTFYQCHPPELMNTAMDTNAAP